MWFDTLAGLLLSTGSIVLLAAGVQSVGHLFSSQITMRIFLLSGTALYLVYYYVVADKPLWPAMFGTACIGVTSVYGLLRVLINRSKWIIGKEHMHIYEKMALIEPGVFRKLINLSELKTFKDKAVLTEFGKVPDCVYYTLQGEVDVAKGPFEFPVAPYSFIGEISIVGGFGATATVHAPVGTTALVWDRRSLLLHMEKNERFRVAVEALFARDMAIKLAQAAKVT